MNPFEKKSTPKENFIENPVSRTNRILNQLEFSDEDAKFLTENVFYLIDAVSPEKLHRAHKIIDALDLYMSQNGVSLIEKAGGLGLIPEVFSDFYKFYEPNSPEEDEPIAKDATQADYIYMELKRGGHRFYNYFLQKHIEEILNNDFYYETVYCKDDDDDIDDSVPFFMPENRFENPDNEYMRWFLKKDFGIDIAKYSSTIRKNFFDFLNTRNIENISSLKKFVSKFGDNGLGSFLSLEHGGQEMGDKILAIGEKFDQATADAIFAKYAELADAVSLIENELKLYSSEKTALSPEQVAENLLKEGKDILISFSNASQGKISPKEVLSKLEDINANVLLTRNILQQLPREEIARLDLNKIPHIDKIENIPANKLLSSPEILSQIKDVINAQFPAGDDAVFEKECETNRDLRVTLTLANKKVVSFFTKEKRSENFEYIDWFIANPDAPIKGLGEATLRLGVDSSENEKSGVYYAVAKPHAKSFQIMIENLGFVAFEGSTKDAEYKHHYSRIRKFPSDREFASKNIRSDQMESFFATMRSICSRENETHNMLFEGKSLRVCKTAYHNQTHHSNIQKSDPDGWLMAEIDKQSDSGYVLTRFIPEKQTGENQTFYAIFEKDTSSEDLRTELSSVVFPDESSSHSATKNTLRN